MNKSEASAFAWFGAGIACGAAIGLLIAPYPGRRSRKLLVETPQQIYERGRETVDVLHDSADVAKRARNLSRPLGEKS